MKQTLLLSLCLGLWLTTTAQWSAEARFGGETGLSLKKYSSSNRSAFEVITAFNFDENIDGFSISPMWEKFGSLTDKGNLSAFLGPGINLIWGDEFYFGVSGIFGLAPRQNRPAG
jgi:hypothetical protein